jgi:hypothetical protein
MALTPLQRNICRTLAARRRAGRRRPQGRAVLTPDGRLFAGSPDELSAAMRAGAVVFHPGRIGGAFPRLIDRSPQ